MTDYDEAAYYEVQLNNKQLVFFFMAAVAIAVVVFLCGVMVGRGVRDAALAVAQTDIAAGSSTPIARTSTTTSNQASPRLDFQEQLSGEKVPTSLEPISSSPETEVKQASGGSPPKPAPKPAAPPPPKPGTEVKAASTMGAASGRFTIQVVALKTEEAARSLLSKLQGKNYRAYLEGGEAGLHRVRVGRFATRADAEKVAQRLRDEEKFKPYITQ